jgi:hypothetical protein
MARTPNSPQSAHSIESSASGSSACISSENDPVFRAIAAHRAAELVKDKLEDKLANSDRKLPQLRAQFEGAVDRLSEAEATLIATKPVSLSGAAALALRALECATPWSKIVR